MDCGGIPLLLTAMSLHLDAGLARDVVCVLQRFMNASPAICAAVIAGGLVPVLKEALGRYRDAGDADSLRLISEFLAELPVGAAAA